MYVLKILFSHPPFFFILQNYMFSLSLIALTLTEAFKKENLKAMLMKSLKLPCIWLESSWGFYALLNLYSISAGHQDTPKQAAVSLQKLKLTYVFSKDDTCLTRGLRGTCLDNSFLRTLALILICQLYACNVRSGGRPTRWFGGVSRISSTARLKLKVWFKSHQNNLHETWYVDRTQLS